MIPQVYFCIHILRVYENLDIDKEQLKLQSQNTKLEKVLRPIKLNCSSSSRLYGCKIMLSAKISMVGAGVMWKLISQQHKQKENVNYNI